MRSHLVILGERNAIAWVLTQRRMAFTAERASAAEAAIAVGDELFLYSTRGAFHNPSTHRGRVFGRAIAGNRVKRLAKPISLVGREFTHSVPLRLTTLAPPHQGIDLASMIGELSSFPNKRGWPVALRRPHAGLTPEDAQLLGERLESKAVPLEEAVAAFAAESRPVRPSSSAVP